MSELLPAPRRVLIAEDVHSIALLAKTVLVNRGFEVETTADGEECLSKAESWRPDLILLDLMMPKVHGMEVLRRLKTNPETRQIGVILCTAKRYKPDQDLALALGALDVLSKPFDKDQLVATVNRFFSGLPAPTTVTPAGLKREIYVPEIPADRPRCPVPALRVMVATPPVSKSVAAKTGSSSMRVREFVNLAKAFSPWGRAACISLSRIRIGITSKDSRFLPRLTFPVMNYFSTEQPGSKRI